MADKKVSINGIDKEMESERDRVLSGDSENLNKEDEQPRTEAQEESLLKEIYDFLTSMKTAVVLLVLIGFASFIGTLVPQYKLGGQMTIDNMKQIRPLQYRIYEFFGLFDIYHTAWFLSLLALVTLSLLLCQIPRVKKIWKRTMTPKYLADEEYYAKFKNNAKFHLQKDVPGTKEELKRLLGARLYRIRHKNEGEKILFDAGRRRWGAFASLIFHFSFLIVGVGIIIGLLFGFNGYLEIIEQKTGYVAEGNFTQVKAEGPFFKSHKPFGLYVSEFNVVHGPGGGPRGFVAHLNIIEDGKNIKKTEVRMNRPLDWNGYRLFQQSYGFAPDIKIEDGQNISLVDNPVKFWLGQDQSYGQSYLDFPGRENLTFEMFVVPADPTQFGLPFIEMKVKEGTADPKEIFQGRVYEGESANIGDYKFTFKKMMDYTGLNIAYNPGITIIYTGMTLGSIAILFSLYFHERRIWAVISPNGKGTHLRIGGLSSRDMPKFSREFDAISHEIAETIKGRRS